MDIVESTVHWSTSDFLKKQMRVKRKGGKRWISENGIFFYEWDELHGEIEVYSLVGEHVRVLDANGQLKKAAKKGRRIDV
jgi:hypothetical protein